MAASKTEVDSSCPIQMHIATRGQHRTPIRYRLQGRPLTAAVVSVSHPCLMSISVREATRYECARDGCDGQFTEPKAVAGSYCSSVCRDRERGENLLQDLAYDHRFCGSCFKPRKVVYRPDAYDVPKLRDKAVLIRESFVGFEELTEFAGMGPHGIECECGNIDHFHAEDLFRQGEPYEWYLKLAVTKLREEGRHEYEFDIQTFADELWHDGDTDAGADFALAIGRAIDTPD